VLALGLAAWLAGGAASAEPAATDPVIALIIDDMGNQRGPGRQAVALPGQVTYAFLPFTPHASPLASAARRAGKEIMLHLPMASHPWAPLGPGGLEIHMTEREFKSTLEASLRSLPDVRGVNNHMGSLLTRHPGAMNWVMEALADHGGLYFIDSRTTVATVAEQLAQEHELPNARRDVFLDHVRDPREIRREFRRLLSKARAQGAAVGIGHPYPETLAVLREELKRLGGSGVRLVPVSELIALKESRAWPESSSPSPRVVKNSKR
jgi:polysaccharide deacetylase 2 family uncharacterized protein YibQ